jgi:hypothetical protein
MFNTNLKYNLTLQPYSIFFVFTFFLFYYNKNKYILWSYTLYVSDFNIYVLVLDPLFWI